MLKKPSRRLQRFATASILMVASGVGFANTGLPPQNQLLTNQYRSAADNIDVSRTVEAAKRGDATAQFNLGLMLYKGQKVPQNRNMAIKLLKAAADQGHQKARVNYDIYTMSDEVLPLIVKGATQGDAFSQYNLGRMYFYGENVTKDYDKAFDWFARAGNQGYPDAQYAIGIMTLNGESVQKDERTAFQILENSASLGHGDSQAMVGIMYRNGIGTPRNHRKAFEWFGRAAAQEKPVAQVSIGMMYLYGEGIAKDPNKAAIWFNRACNNGFNDGCKAKQMLSQKINNQRTGHMPANNYYGQRTTR